MKSSITAVDGVMGELTSTAGPADGPGGVLSGQVLGVREEIVSSWQRCYVVGLRPERFEVPYLPDPDDDGPLSWSAGPVLERLAGDLAGTGAGLLLTDARGHVLHRAAAERGVLRLLDHIELAPGFLYGEQFTGTNAIGTAIAQQSAATVRGPEHFANALGRVACAASPITDPAGRLVGVIDLTCSAKDFSPLMLPLVKQAAADVGHRLAAAAEYGAASARSVAAADDARRQIERDLHDGLQQRLVALGLTLRRAEAALPDAAAVKDELGRVAGGLTEALDHLRDIARGMYPAILCERGLGAAVRAAARRSPVPVLVDVRLPGRLPRPVETAAYYIVSEAMANAAKHAQASKIEISAAFGGRMLALTVADDGLGGASAAGGSVHGGSGLAGIADRAAALGGTMHLTSPPGQGTRIDVRIPVGSC
jgi:signal transduction histidine kinase